MYITAQRVWVGVGIPALTSDTACFIFFFPKVLVHIFCWPDNRWMNSQSEPMGHLVVRNFNGKIGKGGRFHEAILNVFCFRNLSALMNFVLKCLNHGYCNTDRRQTYRPIPINCIILTMQSKKQRKLRYVAKVVRFEIEAYIHT